MEKIFEDIGKKLQTIAKVIFVVTILLFAVCFVVLLVTLDEEWMLFVFPFLCIILGPISACLCAFPLYALGQLVDDIHQMRKGGQQKVGSETDELPEL